MIIYKKDIPIYFGKLIIVVSNDFNKTLKKLGLNYTEDYNEYGGLADHYDDKYLIVLPVDPNHGIIAHEALHVVNFILAESAHKPDYDNDEPICFLLDYIITEIYKFLEKNKIQVKI